MNEIKTRSRLPLNNLAQLKSLGPLAPHFRVGLLPLRQKPGVISHRLPFRRSLVAILLTGGMLALFTIPLWTVGGLTAGPGDGSLFDLVFKLFALFWMLAWCTGVGLLALAFLGLLFGCELLQLEGRHLTLWTGLAGIGVGLRFQARAVGEPIFEEPVSDSDQFWRGGHLRFDYGGATIRLGSALDAAQASLIAADIRQLVRHAADSMEIDIDRWSTVTPVAGLEQSPLRQAQTGSTDPLALRALILANLIPLGGVLVADWTIGEVMLLFWAESAVIGFFNLLKMWKVGGWGILLMGPFFIGHFGAFMAGHLLFIYALVINGLDPGSVSVARVVADFAALWPALLALFISHGLSYKLNFLDRREYLGRDMRKQMSEPYQRIIIMHITLILGGFLVMAMDTPLVALLLLIAMKMGVDIHAHLKQHRSLAAHQEKGDRP